MKIQYGLSKYYEHVIRKIDEEWDEEESLSPEVDEYDELLIGQIIWWKQTLNLFIDYRKHILNVSSFFANVNTPFELNGY